MALSWAKPSSAVVGLSLLAMGDAAAFQSAFCPSIFTVRAFRARSDHSAHTANDVRGGMALGSALALGVGYGASLVSESVYPLLATAAAMALFWAAYEWALRNPRGSQRDSW